MEQLEIIIPGGQKLSVRNFVEWEYNGGKADFQPDEHYPLWGTVPIEDKLRYIAISVFGDLASYGKYDNRIGVTDGESEHYLFFTVQGKDEDILLALNVMLNVIYTSAEGKCRKETGTSFAELPLMQRFDAVTRYIEDEFETCLMMLSDIPYMQWT